MVVWLYVWFLWYDDMMIWRYPFYCIGGDDMMIYYIRYMTYFSWYDDYMLWCCDDMKTYDIWSTIYDIWFMIYDMMTYDMLSCWRDAMWYLVCDMMLWCHDVN